MKSDVDTHEIEEKVERLTTEEDSVLWLELQAWQNGRTLMEQFEYMETNRAKVDSILEAFMEFKYERRPIATSPSSVGVPALPPSLSLNPSSSNKKQNSPPPSLTVAPQQQHVPPSFDRQSSGYVSDGPNDGPSSPSRNSSASPVSHERSKSPLTPSSSVNNVLTETAREIRERAITPERHHFVLHETIVEHKINDFTAFIGPRDQDMCPGCLSLYCK
jgi:hypothetical protein